MRKHLELTPEPWVIRHRYGVVLAALLATLACGSGMLRLTFTNDMRVFFSERNPQLKALEALEDVYTRDDNVLFIVVPADGEVFTRETLAAIESLTASAWQMPFTSRVDSLTNFQHSRAEGDELIVEALFEQADTLAADEIASRRRIALNEPLLVDRLLSRDGRVTAVNATIIVPGVAHSEIDEVSAYARELIRTCRERYPRIGFMLGGGVMADATFGEAGERDALTLVPLMFLMLVGLLGLLLRSFTGMVATLMVIVSAMITGMGLAGWAGVELTAASVSAPVIILTLAVADSVHLLETTFQEMRLGRKKNDAIAESVRVNLGAVALTSVTTAIGFLSMNFSDAPPLRDLGNIVAAGVLAAFVYSLFLLPALVAILPVRVRSDPRAQRSPPCDGWARFVLKHPRAVLAASLLGSLLIGAGTLANELNDDFIKYFGKGFEIRRAMDFMEEHLTGFNVIEYSLESGGTGGINDPAYLATVEAFAQWYRTQPKVAHVTTITDILKRLNMNMHGDDERYRVIPADREFAAQYLLLYEMSLPFGLDLTNRINLSQSASRASVLLRGTTAREIRETDARARDWLREHAPPGMWTHGTGLSVIWAHISERNIANMLVASIGALVLISVLLGLVFRSWQIGLLSLVPNLTPALMAFGVWGFAVGQVGLALSVIVSMTLGIIVDDTVHFLSRYLRARRERGMSPPEAVRRAFNTVGTAMWITTLALMAGFGVLAFSEYRMSADMGLMSALTIGFALLLDFLLLPVLLLRLDRGAGNLARGPLAAAG